MRAWLLAPLRSVLTEWTHRRSPDEVGLGVAMGLMIGLVPVENATAACLGVLLLALRTNVSAAALAIPVGLVIGWGVDDHLDALGRLTLTSDRLRPFWEAFFAFPGASLTRLNNTVVLGSLLVGAGALVPVWLVTRTVWGFAGRRLAPKAIKSRTLRAVAGPDLVTDWGGP